MAGPTLGWLLALVSVSTVVTENASPTFYTVNVTIAPDNSYYDGTLTVGTLLKEETNALKLVATGFNITGVSVMFLSYDLFTTYEVKDGVLYITSRIKWPKGTLTVNIGYRALITQSLTGLYSTKCYDNKTFLTGLDLLNTVFPKYENQQAVPVNLTINQSQRTLLKYSGYSTDNIGWISGPKSQRKSVNIIYPCSVISTLNDELLDAAATVLSDLVPENYTIFPHPDLYMPSAVIRNTKTILIREEYIIKDTWSDWYSNSASSVVLSSVIQQRLGFNDSGSEWLALGLSEYFKHKTIAKMTNESNSQGMWQMEVDHSLQMSSLKKTLPLDFAQQDELYSSRPRIDQTKAGMMIKMLEIIYGEIKFMDIIKDVITNSTQQSPMERLFNHLRMTNITIQSNNMTVADIFSPWLKQPGYPIITATMTSDSVRLSQKTSNNEVKWIPIPIWTRSAGTISKLGTYWLGPTDIIIPLPGEHNSLIFNNGVSGYYRVHMAGKQAKSDKEDIRIVADALALASMKKMEYNDALDKTFSLSKSRTEAWSLAIPYLSKLSSSLLPEDRRLLKDYIVLLLDEFSVLLNYSNSSKMANINTGNSSTELKNVTLSPELSTSTKPSVELYNITINGNTYYLNGSNTWDNSSMVPILESFCKSGFLCSTLYMRYHKEALNITTSNYRGVTVGALCAGAEVDPNLTDILMMSSSSIGMSKPLKNKLLTALSCSINTTQTKWLLDSFIQTDSMMSRQDFIPTISTIITTEEKAEAVFVWLNNTWDNVTNYMPGNQEAFEDIITSISNHVFDYKLMKKVEHFVKPRIHSYAISRAFERMKMNSWHRENQNSPLRNWLINNSQGVHSSANSAGISILIIFITLLLSLTNQCRFI